MRSERLLSLLLTLADGRLHGAPELASAFGVSQRSIYRDMDTLSCMGFPIEAIPGRQGGFRVLPGYAFDRSVLDSGELSAVTAALEGLGRATGLADAGGARSKLAALVAAQPNRRGSWLRIELAGGAAERSRLDLLRGAIESRNLLAIGYRDTEGRSSERTIEPVAIVYLWQSWYLWAFCRLRNDFRLFRLSRITRMRPLMARFDERPEPSPDAWRESWESGGTTAMKLRFSPGLATRADESFEETAPLPDGGRLVSLELPENEWLYGYLLSFGAGLTVLEPERVARELATRASEIAENYAFPGKA
jgi:predicted DNA-binding transcriptional regulator YafY